MNGVFWRKKIKSMQRVLSLSVEGGSSSVNFQCEHSIDTISTKGICQDQPIRGYHERKREKGTTAPRQLLGLGRLGLLCGALSLLLLLCTLGLTCGGRGLCLGRGPKGLESG